VRYVQGNLFPIRSGASVLRCAKHSSGSSLTHVRSCRWSCVFVLAQLGERTIATLGPQRCVLLCVVSVLLTGCVSQGKYTIWRANALLCRAHTASCSWWCTCRLLKLLKALVYEHMATVSHPQLHYCTKCRGCSREAGLAERFLNGRLGRLHTLWQLHPLTLKS
jgi:hypothetical protein